LSAISKGFVTLSDQDVVIRACSFLSGGTAFNPQSWSYSQDLAFKAEIELISGKNKLEALKIPELSALSLLVVATCKRSRFTKVSDLVALSETTRRTSVSLEIEPWCLREAVSFELQLVLSRDLARKGLDVIFPGREGAVIWSNQVLQKLEGSAPELALRVVSGHPAFGGSPRGLWYVKLLTSDMNLSADLCVEVLLNQSNPDVMAMIREPESDSSRVMRNRLAFDVFKYLAGLGLAEGESFDAHANYAPETLGFNVSSVLKTFGEDIETLRDLRKSDERLFETRLQSLVGGGL